jgi:hypothetical protein
MSIFDLSPSEFLGLLLVITLLLSLMLLDAMETGVVEEEDAAELFRAGERHDRAVNRS